MNPSVTDMLLTVKDEPVHVLTMCDMEYTKIVLLTLGQKSACIDKMRQVSEVLHVSGDPVIDDMSRTLSGYPTINHSKVHMQVITVQDYLEGSRDTKSLSFEATGAHLS